ncbi:helix-turn-helix domain-containing protein [Streptococcus canis]|uniref:helix-turn-helix domain-containing protein n=1 Tax=Streptococcus canis TaxID=1329 RepID=UPI0013DAC8DC|nr:helix-turn-helix domain-containing protein [Streptococcus canis]QKG73720.1 helix-turn-helix domain-containing protein [Streptococcus canis]
MKVFDGLKMRNIRKDARLTQYDIAPMVGISQNRVSDIERNVIAPTVDEIDAFAEALNTHVSVFLSDDTDIEVITNTFTKKKKETDQTEHFEGIKVDNSSEQLELFPSEKLSLGSDLAGYVILSTEIYAELLESQGKLHKLQSLLK